MYPQDALALDVHRCRQADAVLACRAMAARRAADTQVDDHTEAVHDGRHPLPVRASGWLRGLVGTLSGRGATTTISTLRRA